MSEVAVTGSESAKDQSKENSRSGVTNPGGGVSPGVASRVPRWRTWPVMNVSCAGDGTRSSLGLWGRLQMRRSPHVKPAIGAATTLADKQRTEETVSQVEARRLHSTGLHGLERGTEGRSAACAYVTLTTTPCSQEFSKKFIVSK